MMRQTDLFRIIQSLQLAMKARESTWQFLYLMKQPIQTFFKSGSNPSLGVGYSKDFCQQYMSAYRNSFKWLGFYTGAFIALVGSKMFKTQIKVSII